MLMWFCWIWGDVTSRFSSFLPREEFLELFVTMMMTTCTMMFIVACALVLLVVDGGMYLQQVFYVLLGTKPWEQ